MRWMRRGSGLVVEVDVEVVEDWRWMCSGSGLIQHEMLTCRPQMIL